MLPKAAAPATVSDPFRPCIVAFLRRDKIPSTGPSWSVRPKGFVVVIRGLLRNENEVFCREPHIPGLVLAFNERHRS